MIGSLKVAAVDADQKAIHKDPAGCFLRLRNAQQSIDCCCISAAYLTPRSVSMQAHRPVAEYVLISINARLDQNAYGSGTNWTYPYTPSSVHGGDQNDGAVHERL